MQQKVSQKGRQARGNREVQTRVVSYAMVIRHNNKKKYIQWKI